MAVIAWIVEATWAACIDATSRFAPAHADVVLLHVTEPDVADLAHGAYAGLLGRGQPHRDPGTRVEHLASAAATQLLDDASARLGRRCSRVERVGRCETEVISAASGAELLVLCRDGDCTRLGPHSLSHASRYVVDHAPCPVLLVWPGLPPRLGGGPGPAGPG
jgi:nucleotide-binding universal stress UspA family protein